MTPPPERLKNRLRLAAVALALLVAAAGLFARVASSRHPASPAPLPQPAPAAAAAAQATLPPADFKNFEAPQVHPLALTPDGTRLLAVNSPNATLSVFQLSGGAPVLTAEIPVGLGPVSVAAREKNRAFVLMQYFGYLRRNPEDPPEETRDLTGFNFWLGKLDNHGGNFVSAEMVKSFLVSGEYLGRFRQ